MGGSGSGYSKNGKLTKDDIRKKHRSVDGDGYLFDVEYQKLKEEQERIQREYDRERAEYLRVTERLRQEMLGGSANMADRQRFMAALSDMGVQLQKQQTELQNQIDKTLALRTDVDRQMDDLRQRAFAGSTSTYRAADRDDYKGFEAKASNRVDYSKARIVEMSPAEYLRRIAFNAKGGGFRDLLNNASPALIDKYARQMLRGTKFNAPSLNASNRSNDPEKALAAIMNGYTRIPVLIIE